MPARLRAGVNSTRPRHALELGPRRVSSNWVGTEVGLDVWETRPAGPLRSTSTNRCNSRRVRGQVRGVRHPPAAGWRARPDGEQSAWPCQCRHHARGPWAVCSGIGPRRGHLVGSASKWLRIEAISATIPLAADGSLKAPAAGLSGPEPCRTRLLAFSQRHISGRIIPSEMRDSNYSSTRQRRRLGRSHESRSGLRVAWQP